MSHLRQISPWARAMLAIAALAVTAIAVSVATTASGADSEDRGDVTFATPPDLGAIDDFKDCMSEHGVDVPEPGEPFDGPRGVHEPSASEREAFDACGDELPRPPRGAVMLGGPADPEAFDDFRNCMSDHGVDVPEPPKGRSRHRLDAPSAAEQDAFEACGDQLPEPPVGACPPPGRPPAPGMSQD